MFVHAQRGWLGVVLAKLVRAVIAMASSAPDTAVFVSGARFSTVLATLFAVHVACH